MKKLILSVLLGIISLNVLAETKTNPTKKEASSPAIKPLVKKPCKVDQKPEKDNCHQIKK